jgi:hypothetical protein
MRCWLGRISMGSGVWVGGGLGWIVTTPDGRIFFFFFFVHWKSRRRWAVGGGVWAGGPLFGCLIGCFVLILCLCVFLEMLRC